MRALGFPFCAVCQRQIVRTLAPYLPITWSDWESLGGSCMQGPAANSAATNRLDTFVVGTDGALWHRWWDGASWSGWESLGGLCFGGSAAVSWSPDRTDTFVIGIDSELWHKRRG